jgi:hypothetical protein
VLAGSFQRWSDFSATTLRTADESSDPFVAAVGADGFAWARSIPAEGAAVAQSLVPAGRRIAVAITFAGSLQLGESHITPGRAEAGGLVALVGSGGELLWARPIAGSSSADALAAAGSDGFLVAGASASGGYVALLSAGGRPLWSQAIGDSPGRAQPLALAAIRGAALVGGSSSEKLAIGRFSIEVAGESDGFVARLPFRPSRPRRGRGHRANIRRSGSSMRCLSATRKDTASRPSTTRWS